VVTVVTVVGLTSSTGGTDGDGGRGLELEEFHYAAGWAIFDSRSGSEAIVPFSETTASLQIEVVTYFVDVWISWCINLSYEW
jgi:hypothetical protein